MTGNLPRVARIVLVTLALSGAGAAAGAVLGVAPVAVISLVLGGVEGMRNTVEVWPFLAAIGGAIGAVLGPSLAWLLLRHVPLGRAILQCTLGGLMGFIVGVVLPDHRDYNMEIQPIMMAVIGAVCAAVRLRLRHPRRASSLPSTGAPESTAAVRPQRDAAR